MDMKGSWELCISVKEKTFRFTICRVNKKNGKIEVARAFQIDIPEEFASSRDIIAAGAIIGIVRTALRNNSPKIKKYNLCISDKSIITRVVKLPKMELNDLKSFMKLSIYQYFPIRVEDYTFDFKIQAVDEKDEKNYYNLLLVAIPKAIIDFYSNIFLKCGLKPKVISIYSDVVASLFLKLIKKDIAIVDMNYDYTEFAITEGKSIFINSIINYALPKNELDLNEDTYLSQLDLDALGQEFSSTVESLKNYLNFFSTRHQGKVIEEIYFIGEGAMMKEIIYSLEETLGVKIKTGQDAFTGKIIATSMPSTMKRQFFPERYCSCLGLLMR